VADIGAEVELGEFAVIAVAVVVIGYALYKSFGTLGGGLKSAWNSVSDSVSNAAASVNQAVQKSSQDSQYVVPGTGLTIQQLENCYGYTSCQVTCIIQQQGDCPQPFGQCSD